MDENIFDKDGFDAIQPVDLKKTMEDSYIDYAMSAKGYGFVTYPARNEKELREALADSLKQTSSTLIDIKVLPKSMTHGYGGWWNVGCTQNPRSQKGKEALANKEKMLEKARKY